MKKIKNIILVLLIIIIFLTIIMLFNLKNICDKNTINNVLPETIDACGQIQISAFFYSLGIISISVIIITLLLYLLKSKK